MVTKIYFLNTSGRTKEYCTKMLHKLVLACFYQCQIIYTDSTNTHQVPLVFELGVNRLYIDVSLFPTFWNLLLCPCHLQDSDTDKHISMSKKFSEITVTKDLQRNTSVATSAHYHINKSGVRKKLFMWMPIKNSDRWRVCIVIISLHHSLFGRNS